MSEPLDLEPLRARYGSRNMTAVHTRQSADDVAVLLTEVEEQRGALTRMGADLLRCRAEAAGLCEAVKRYVEELKSAYAERDQTRLNIQKVRKQLQSVSAERDSARDELRAMTAERDNAVDQANRGVRSCVHVDVASADRVRDDAVRADERRDILVKIRALPQGITNTIVIHELELSFKRQEPGLLGSVVLVTPTGAHYAADHEAISDAARRLLGIGDDCG